MMKFWLVVVMAVMAVTGCQSQIYFTEKHGCTETYCESVAEAMDLYDTDFTWPTEQGALRFKTGAAVTTEDQWAKVVGEAAGPMVEAAICAQNPLLCAQVP